MIAGRSFGRAHPLRQGFLRSSLTCWRCPTALGQSKMGKTFEQRETALRQ